MTINEKHYLEGDSIEYLECLKNKQEFGEGLPDTIILHYTEGRGAESSAKWMARGDVKASAHVVVSKDGSIIQLVPFDIISWHAGTSQYKGRKSFNQYSIGIEMDNAGILESNGVSKFGRKYYDNEIFIDKKGQKWHKYTDEQVAKVKELCLLLVEKYNIKTILGHSDIAPKRKKDPGKAFPLEEFKKLLHP